MVDSFSSSPARAGCSGMDAEDCFDGITLARLAHQGQEWLMGASLPDWKNALLTLPLQPTAQDLEAAARQGVWLAPRRSPLQRPRLAVMCCGQGSVWPGMGRALYDNFPAARDAMDCIARAADWDVLSLMDETDIEKIGLTRWQQPYLFLLEYAQGAYLRSLGLRPDVLCGHSLGELVALCLAGVYTPEEAWYIFDIRSQYVNALEEQADRSTGMMAVYAPDTVITELLAAQSEVRISNYNTPTQFILSGPREALLDIRRNLRKRRIPAIILNISLAFHHPDMRVLRPVCRRLLNRLDMKPPRLPMLSNVTVGPYPDTRAAICEYILDLDENAVRWVECVDRMWTDYHVRHFLELGPADTLCGLTTDIRRDARCIPAGGKGADAEVEAMRCAVAQLYALGHLPERGVRVLPGTPLVAPLKQSSATPERSPALSSAPRSAGEENVWTAAVMDVLAEVCQLPREQLRTEMDLRRDLAIRSIRFPAIMLRAEEVFQVSLQFEDLANVATIGDLARVLARLQGTLPAGTPAPESSPSPARVDTAPKEAPDVPVPDDACPQWREDTTGSSLIFPLPEDPSAFLVAGETALAVGGHHFSLYADDWPKRCRTGTEQALPEAVLAGCLLELAARTFPRRQVTGLENFQMRQWRRCRRGLTLEARLGLGSPSPVDTKRISRCAGRLELRDISPTGRREQHWTDVCTGQVLLTAPGAAPVSLAGELAEFQVVYREDFYVTNVALSGMVQALDVLLEAAQRTFSQGMSPPRLMAVGHMAFAAGTFPDGPLCVEIGYAHGAEGRQYHCGQIKDTHGNTCLTATDLRVSCLPSSA